MPDEKPLSPDFLPPWFYWLSFYKNLVKAPEKERSSPLHTAPNQSKIKCEKIGQFLTAPIDDRAGKIPQTMTGATTNSHYWDIRANGIHIGLNYSRYLRQFIAVPTEGSDMDVPEHIFIPRMEKNPKFSVTSLIFGAPRPWFLAQLRTRDKMRGYILFRINDWNRSPIKSLKINWKTEQKKN